MGNRDASREEFLVDLVEVVELRCESNPVQFGDGWRLQRQQRRLRQQLRNRKNMRVSCYKFSELVHVEPLKKQTKNANITVYLYQKSKFPGGEFKRKMKVSCYKLSECVHVETLKKPVYHETALQEGGKSCIFRAKFLYLIIYCKVIKTSCKMSNCFGPNLNYFPTHRVSMLAPQAPKTAIINLCNVHSFFC